MTPSNRRESRRPVRSAPASSVGALHRERSPGGAAAERRHRSHSLRAALRWPDTRYPPFSIEGESGRDRAAAPVFKRKAGRTEIGAHPPSGSEPSVPAFSELHRADGRRGPLALWYLNREGPSAGGVFLSGKRGDEASRRLPLDRTSRGSRLHGSAGSPEPLSSVPLRHISPAAESGRSVRFDRSSRLQPAGVVPLARIASERCDQAVDHGCRPVREPREVLVQPVASRSSSASASRKETPPPATGLADQIPEASAAPSSRRLGEAREGRHEGPSRSEGALQIWSCRLRLEDRGPPRGVSSGSPTRYVKEGISCLASAAPRADCGCRCRRSAAAHREIAHGAGALTLEAGALRTGRRDPPIRAGHRPGIGDEASRTSAQIDPLRPAVSRCPPGSLRTRRQPSAG